MNRKAIRKITVASIIAVVILLLIIIRSYASFDDYTKDYFDDKKLFEMNFDNDVLKDEVSGKTYQSHNQAGKFESGNKSRGWNPNGDTVIIPVKDIAGLSAKDTVTVSFWLKWSGQNLIMPVAFSYYDLFLWNDDIGFNTAESDMYGTANTLKKNVFTHITAVFHKGDATKNSLYINGVKQSLSMKTGASSSNYANWGDAFSVSGWSSNPGNYVMNSSVIDEVTIYSGGVNDKEVKSLYQLARIPDLRVIDSSGKPRLEWATEMLDSDIIYRNSFEEWDDINGYGYSGSNSISSEDSFDGSRSLKITDSYKYGNNGHSDGQVSAIYAFNRIYGVSVGTKFSASIRLKNIGEPTGWLDMSASGGMPRSTTPFHKLYGLAQPIIVAEDTINTPGEIKIQNFDYLYSNLRDNYMYFVATRQDNDYKADRYVFYKSQLDTARKSIKVGGTSYKAGDVLHYIDTVYPLGLGSKYSYGDGKWVLYNFNGAVREMDYDTYTMGILPYINLQNRGTIYVDDIKFGYATKVMLYRGEDLIYEGYDSDYIDNEAIDKSPPPAVTGITANKKGSALTISFKPSVDIGNEYSYRIKGVSMNGNTPLSRAVIYKAQPSGLAGYSYVIDKNPSTEPDNVIDTTSSTITKNITDGGRYYLHIKAIDMLGNRSATVHKQIDIPSLNAVPQENQKDIHLSWSSSGNSQPYSYKVWRREGSTGEFQSISTNNAEKVVKVLNIYPTYNIPDMATGELDITGKKMKQSATLEKWVKDYGMGLIQVDSLNKEDFEANPNKYLKDSNGKYKYDVVAVGFWNINQRLQHINNAGVEAIRNAIDSGIGVLIGHHHIGYTEFDYGMNLIKDRFNIKLIKEQGAVQTELGNIDYTLPERSPGTDYSYYWNVSSKVKVVKKGALTSFPYEISELGGVFTIPSTHDTWEFAMGDVWFEFDNPTSFTSPWGQPAKNITSLPDGSVGTSNTYLTTWKNTAVIQTGHSSGQATVDEQKILVNTLFYLAQLTTDTELRDVNGRDKNPPSKPAIISGKFDTASNNINIKFNPSNDGGTTYQYYVEATGQNTGDNLESNIASATIKTGLKGYSVQVDNAPTSIPDNVVDTTSTEISIPKPQGTELYIHVKAIDNEGNASETAHLKVEDFTPPQISFTLQPGGWTNGNVSISVKATDNDSGVKSIKLPNGNVINASTTVYTVAENGVYYFDAEDRVGNKSINYVIVNGIDKNSPEVIINNSQEWTNQISVPVEIKGTDR